MQLLALDTATERCSAALWLDGGVRSRASEEPRAHAARILPMIDALLAEAELTLAQLDAIAFGRGPGAFTGVRLAVGVAQGLAFGAGLPLIGISDLAALAHAAYRVHGWRQVAACLDARMGEVYWGRYTLEAAGQARQTGEDALCPPGPFGDLGGWAGAGHGWPLVAAAGHRPADPLDVALLPDAADVAWLASTELQAGRVLAPEAAEPVYLRDRVAVPGRKGATRR